MRRTKIVATIGPASEDPAILAGLVEAGLNVARLNFSHGNHQEHQRKIEDLRAIAARLGRPLAILQDLAGPKIRIGDMAEGKAELEPGGEFLLRRQPGAGDASGVHVDFPPLFDAVRQGDALLLGDGALELEVLASDAEGIRTRVIVGGELGSRKGINLPARSLPTTSLTDKDREDLAFGLAAGVDLVALSFVRDADDISRARALMGKLGRTVPLIAKIEKFEALDHLDAIIGDADGVMVARGDLGVEIPLERVPGVQKDIIRRCNAAGKPVITATQMLRSMVESPRPTRAEVTDVANAILDGSDALMLSEETASGAYPLAAVETMARVAERTEQDAFRQDYRGNLSSPACEDIDDAVAKSACELAAAIGAAAIIPYTRSGSTAKLVARYRPRQPILAPTFEESSYRELCLVWGVEPILCERMETTETMAVQALELARGAGLVASGQRVVITAGLPLGNSPQTNVIKAETCP